MDRHPRLRLEFPFVTPSRIPNDLIPLEIVEEEDENSDIAMSDDEQMSDTSVVECASCLNAKRKANNKVKACRKKPSLKRKRPTTPIKKPVKTIKKAKTPTLGLKKNGSASVGRRT